MSSSAAVFLIAIFLMVAVYVVVKTFSKGRKTPSFPAVELIVVALVAIACFIALFKSK